jgi:hypothetical protein
VNFMLLGESLLHVLAFQELHMLRNSVGGNLIVCVLASSSLILLDSQCVDAY